MKPGYSIRARLLLGAALVLLAFLAGAGLAVERAHADSVRDAHFARLQSTVYLLLARAELDDAGALVMPPELPEPRLSVPGSGLYAAIYNPQRRERWQSASSLGREPPFLREGVQVGQWRYGTVPGASGEYLMAAYGVRWAGRNHSATLVLTVLEDKAALDKELAIFSRTLWLWLGGAALLLLLAQVLLLQWGLAPLARVTREVRRVEAGEQLRIDGKYPTEILGLTDNLNTLIEQERVRQKRYKEALSYLAHSLKTPLAVLRGALANPPQLPAAVEQQVARMDEIVQHQLGRAGAGGATRFAPRVPLAPIAERIRDALTKVYADKGLTLELQCDAQLGWRIDEGDVFELLGNLLDNAAKWARSRVRATLWQEAGRLHIRVDDDGPGFSDTESVLQIHVRGDERVPGHGVGLAMVKDLVDSHHGQLSLTRGELGGARVEIVLPPP